MHHVKSNLTGGANPIRGKGLRIHWKEKTASLPWQAVVCGNWLKGLNLTLCLLLHSFQQVINADHPDHPSLILACALSQKNPPHLHSLFGHKAELVKVPSSVPSTHLGNSFSTLVGFPTSFSCEPGAGAWCETFLTQPTGEADPSLRKFFFSNFKQ